MSDRPPAQLTPTTTTRTTIAAAERIRRRDHPRAQAGSRLVSRSGLSFTGSCPSPPPWAAGGGQRGSAAAGGDPADLRELVGVQARATDECTVDVWPGRDPGRPPGLPRPSVEDTDALRGLHAESLGEPRPQCPTDLLRIIRR